MTKQQQQEDTELIRFHSDLREVLKTGPGKNVIWNVLAKCGIYQDSFTGNSQSYYLEGKRAVGLEILADMEDVDPTAYARLLLNHQKEK